MEPLNITCKSLLLPLDLQIQREQAEELYFYRPGLHDLMEARCFGRRESTEGTRRPPSQKTRNGQSDMDL
jgi:hypothetical protein